MERFSFAGLGGRILPVWLLVLGTFALPAFDLSGSLGAAAVLAADAGGKLGAPLAAALALALVLTRPGPSAAQRGRELGVLLGALAVFLGGGAWLNEHVVKPRLAVPRPNLVELAAAEALGEDAAAFYARGDKEVRRHRLREVLEAPGFHAVALHPAVREHWIEETGYSFPSGHATAALTFATLFVALGLLLLEGRRRLLIHLLLPWALAVCYSRPVLRVHSPADVTVGGLQGIALGLAAFVAARALLGAPGASDDAVEQQAPAPAPGVA